jgi:Meiotically up-regulated gene 113
VEEMSGDPNPDAGNPIDSRVPPKPESFERQAIQSEIEAVLQVDEGALGDVFRRLRAGQSPEEIRVARGAERPNFIWNYSRTIQALVEGELPTAPTVALQTARTFRRLLRETRFTAGTREELERRLSILESRGADANAKAAEEKLAVQATVDAEENAVSGVYVYSLPHYLRHPYDEVSGRTLMKVGRADRSVIKRFRDQTRTTALPEDPVLLRVYPCDEDGSTDLEGKFHRLLEAADHDRSKARTGGTEWFLTSVKFLDEIAATLNLDVREVSELAQPID